MASANISKKRKVRIHSDCQLESTDESEVWKDEGDSEDGKKEAGRK